MKSLLPWALCHPTGKLSEDGNDTVTGLTRDRLGTRGPWSFHKTSRVHPPFPAQEILWGGPGFLQQRGLRCPSLREQARESLRPGHVAGQVLPLFGALVSQGVARGPLKSLLALMIPDTLTWIHAPQNHI